MLVHHRVANSIKFNGIHLVGDGSVGVQNYLAQGHNTMASWLEKLKSFDLPRFLVHSFDVSII